MTKKQNNIGTALHKQPQRTEAEQLKADVLAVADEVFDRYAWGESFQQIADTLPFKVQGWKLRSILMSSPETEERYATVGIERAHNLVDAALDYARKAAAIGDAAGLRVAVDTNLKVAAKLNSRDYGDSKKVELTGEGGGPVKLLAMTDEELMKIAAQGLKEEMSK